ncbi:hypothetical protein SESBI_06482 [Sesbania bispinosa]|nr:hypothetical protein SESBI_06482 [Sesbania bispinosa]
MKMLSLAASLAPRPACKGEELQLLRLRGGTETLPELLRLRLCEEEQTRDVARRNNYCACERERGTVLCANVNGAAG